MPILAPLAKIYAYFSKKNAEANADKIVLNVPVISVGNICLGGSGKTPLCILIANKLKERNISPAIVSRGYKRKSKEDLIVCDGKQILTAPEQCGDEPYLIAKKTKSISAVSKKKYRAAQNILARFAPDCIIIDDGFQHFPLHRDIDIVIVQASDLSNPYTLPLGRLREDISALSRADFIAIDSKVDISLLEKYKSQSAKIIKTVNLPSAPYNYFTEKKIDPNFKNGFIALSGIALPERFFKSLAELNLSIKSKFIFSDHYNYKESDVLKLIEKAKKENLNLITTEKDAVKLETYSSLFADGATALFALPIETRIINNEDALINSILQLIEKKQS